VERISYGPEFLVEVLKDLVASPVDSDRGVLNSGGIDVVPVSSAVLEGFTVVLEGIVAIGVTIVAPVLFVETEAVPPVTENWFE
jgi:hypothetical protein